MDRGGSDWAGIAEERGPGRAQWRRAVEAMARFVRRSVFGRLSEAERDSLILDVAALVRMGKLAEADRKLNASLRGLSGDGGFINLCGVVCELRGEREHALRFYEMAVKVDGDCRAGWQNLKRLRATGELVREVREIALGDGEVRKTRHLPGEPGSMPTAA